MALLRSFGAMPRCDCALVSFGKSSENLKEWDRYRKVDFSDAMDMERDGFVQYLIATGQLETSETSLHTH
ncbi:hypothetical protein ACPV56_03455 [Vibrio astriarenae]